MSQYKYALTEIAISEPMKDENGTHIYYDTRQEAQEAYDKLSKAKQKLFTISETNFGQPDES